MDLGQVRKDEVFEYHLNKGLETLTVTRGGHSFEAIRGEIFVVSGIPTFISDGDDRLLVFPSNVIKDIDMDSLHENPIGFSTHEDEIIMGMEIGDEIHVVYTIPPVFHELLKQEVDVVDFLTIAFFDGEDKSRADIPTNEEVSQTVNQLV